MTLVLARETQQGATRTDGTHGGTRRSKARRGETGAAPQRRQAPGPGALRGHAGPVGWQLGAHGRRLPSAPGEPAECPQPQYDKEAKRLEFLEFRIIGSAAGRVPAATGGGGRGRGSAYPLPVRGPVPTLYPLSGGRCRALQGAGLARRRRLEARASRLAPAVSSRMRVDGPLGP